MPKPFRIESRRWNKETIRDIAISNISVLSELLLSPSIDARNWWQLGRQYSGATIERQSGGVPSSAVYGTILRYGAVFPLVNFLAEPKYFLLDHDWSIAIEVDCQIMRITRGEFVNILSIASSKDRAVGVLCSSHDIDFLIEIRVIDTV
jgi:hypothetical protein